MEILVIISFFFILSLAEWVSARIIQAGIIGNIAVGIIYGVPLANILEMDWQKTFLSLGYIGLILIIFEGLYSVYIHFGWNIGVDVTPGGLAARLDLLKQNLVLSTLGAATGVCFPIGLSYLLLYLGYGYGMLPIEAPLLVYIANINRCCRDLHYRCCSIGYFSG